MRPIAIAMCVCAAYTGASAAPACRLTGTPWLEGRVGRGKPARAVDARLGETVDVFVAAPGALRGKRVVFGDSGAPGRLSFAEAEGACGAAQVAWRRVEPLMEHTRTRSPNKSVKVYANAVVFGANHGSWIGFDKLEYVDTALPDTTPSLRVVDAKPSEAIGLPARGGKRDPLGVMHLAATLTLAAETRSTPGLETARDGQIADSVFRYTFRDGDGFLGWLSSYFNVPYLFGSAGKGARAQAERYIGADCADVLVAALRRAGQRDMQYTSVAELVGALRKVGGPVELAACDPEAQPCTATTLRYGVDVQPGDLLALDYVSYDDLPRAWDHIVAVVEDSGPDGVPDGVLGPEDLVADSGDRVGLKLAPLGHQGHVRIAVLRPRAGK